jgi:hypothetical protein
LLEVDSKVMDMEEMLDIVEDYTQVAKIEE